MNVIEYNRIGQNIIGKEQNWIEYNGIEYNGIECENISMNSVGSLSFVLKQSCVNVRLRDRKRQKSLEK